MKKLNSFNNIASFYDVLAHVVFGGAIKRAQCSFLNVIPKRSTVLIIGGGTGWIAKEVLTRIPEVKIIFVEASDKMLNKTRKRLSAEESGRITLVHATEIPRNIQVDVVITNFLLDVFTDQSLSLYIDQLQQAMKIATVWLVTDFVDRPVWWQRALLRIMYFYFRLTCAVEAKELPQWGKHLNRAGFNLIGEKDYFFRFIKSAVFIDHRHTSASIGMNE